MALLQESDIAEMVDFLGEPLKEPPAEEHEEATSEVEMEAADGMDSSEAAEDVNEEVASPSDTEEDVKEEPGEEEDVVEVQVQDSEPEEKPRQKDSKWVPRDRLNEVNDKWKQREQELLMQIGALNERASASSQSQVQKQAPAEDDWLSGFIDSDEQQASSSKEIEQLRATQVKMVQWQEEFTRQAIFNEFNKELQEAMEKYPSIPEEAFRNAVARDGSLNMLELGERLSGEREKMVSQWRSEWEAKNKPAAPEAQETAQKTAIRRPSRRSASTAPPTKKPETFKTVREAGDAMANEMAAFFESLQQ